MKNKFERLTKEEKKAAIEEYKKAKPNHEIIVKKLRNLRLIGTIGVVYAVLSFVFDLLSSSHAVYFVTDGILLVAGVLFVVKGKQLLGTYVNEYLINKDKGTKKK